MKIPDIQSYTNCQEFLKDLYSMNKSEGGIGSFRFYAQKLHWPISYLNEVISGKKKLSLNRALELGLFLKLDGVDVERLIHLALIENEHSKIRDYFTSKVKKEGKTEGYFHISEKKQQFVGNMRLVPEEIFSDISLLAIADLINMSRGQITLPEIPKFLYSFPELADLKVLLSKIEVLERYDIIKRVIRNNKVTGFEFKQEQLAFSIDRNTVKHMVQYADNYSKIILGNNPRGWITSGFIKLSRGRLLEAKKRVLAFRNWLLELESEVLADPNYNKKDVLVFQMDVNLLSILDLNYLGINNLDQWIAEASEAKKEQNLHCY